ncbi:MAG: hypothetical protein WCP53_13475 [Verrucomicrobiota bacterium]
MANDSLPSVRLVADRSLAAVGSVRRTHDAEASLSTKHLEEVRDHLVRVTEKQEPEDHERSFSQLHVSFLGGRTTAQFLGAGGLEAEPMLVSRNAYSQMSAELLPGRGGGFLLDMANLGEDGEKLATMSWATFAKRDAGPKMIRTVKMRTPEGKVMRMVRSQHSQGYGTYDNVRFVNDLLNNADGLRDLPITQFNLTDTGMRLRFLGVPRNEVTLQNPVPMIEAWNSEVGRRRVGLTGGMWKLVCTNGMGSWDNKADWHWRHYGDGDRIARGVGSAMKELLTSSSGALKAYEEALDIGIDDAFAYLAATLMPLGATTPFVVQAQKALTDSTTTPNGMLASVVDAITLAAQSTDDLFAQAEYEAFAARILRGGLSRASTEGGRIRNAAEAEAASQPSAK